MAEQVFLTQKGYNELEKRLEVLVVEKRKDVAEKIKVAREYGDISENAEYDAAKEEQAQVEGEILEIQQKLRTAAIIEDTNDRTTINMGSTFVLKNEEKKIQVEYTLVGTTEADPTKNKISNESPVGKAVIGKKQGDIAEVIAPIGIIRYKVMSIK